MGCGFNNLDFSQGLFNFFGSESQGVLHGSWSFGGEGGNSKPSPSPSPKAKPSPSPQHTTTTSSHKDTTTSKHSSTSTSSSSSSSKSTTPTSTPTSSSAPLNPDIETVGTFDSQEINASNLNALNMAFMGLS